MDNINNNNNDNNNNNNNYKKIVLSGGGVKGICHVGALYALDELNILDKIDTFAGTSIGSLVILLYVIGYSPGQIYNFIVSFDFSKMKNISIFNIQFFGFDNCSKMEYVIIRLIQQKGFDPYITLKELYEITKKKIIFTTVCVNTKELCYLSHDTYPELPILISVRMSMSIPFIFTPIKYKNYLYIDGGCFNNYPINLFIDSNDVLGILLVDNKDIVENIDNFETYILNVLWCIFNGKNHVISQLYNNNTIKIVIDSISTIDYSISADKKDELFLKGYNSVLNKLNVK